LKKQSVNKVVIETEIVPYNNLITLANVTNENFGLELTKISPVSGINLLKITDTNGALFKKPQDFFSFLKIQLPATLNRTLMGDYAVGIFSQNNQISYFIIVSINDFGRAFSGMLDWESSMEKDLSFLNPTKEVGVINEMPKNVATSTASTTTKNIATSSMISVKIPLKPEIFNWKDVIVKNKDTRALINEKNIARIAYTFLDKNTILIINNLSAIGDIYNIYSSRSVVR